MTPLPGDRWTRPGKPDLTVLTVVGDTVGLSYGGRPFTMTLDEYATHAASSQRKGDVLHREETEDCMFE